MFDVHYWPTPNGKKVTVLLEECGAEYSVVPCRIGRGDQFSDEFLAISPNNRMPTLVDHAPADGGEPISNGTFAAVCGVPARSVVTTGIRRRPMSAKTVLRASWISSRSVSECSESVASKSRAYCRPRTSASRRRTSASCEV